MDKVEKELMRDPCRDHTVANLKHNFQIGGGVQKDSPKNIVEHCGVRKMMLVKDIREHG